MSARFPFSSYPNGWFAIAYSTDLPAGESRPIKALGRDFVLYRSATGVAHVLDAFCPHLGTHLGHGGRVVGETIQCPFHGWRFDSCGDCVEIPDAKKIPPRAQLAPWTVRERNGVILIHHHHQGAPPAFEIPEAVGFQGGEWTQPVRYGWKMRTHVQEVAENLADVRHFRFLHGLNRPHLVRTEFSAFESLYELADDGSKTDMRLHGLGVELSRIRFDMGAAGEHFFAAKFMTPLDDEHLELRVLISAKIREGNVANGERLAEAFKDLTSRALMQDVPLWETKLYRPQPLLTAEDGPIVQFRRWARQFYPESPTAHAGDHSPE